MLTFIKQLLVYGLPYLILGGGKFPSATESTVIKGDSVGALFAVYAAAFVLAVVVPYLLGSLNFGIILSKKLYGDDVRTHGSHNAGTTNMMRTYGNKAAVITLVCDMLKAVVSVLFGEIMLGQFGFAGGYIAALMCVVGHAFPIFYIFKGGKGVAVMAGAVLALSPAVFGVLVVIFALVVLSTRFISMASVMCMILWPLLTSGWYKITGYENLSMWPVFAVMTSVLIIWLHRENLKRIWRGEENKFSFKKSVKADAKSEDGKGGK